MKRFQPLDIEIGGYLRTFLWCWGIWFVIFIICMGLSMWSLYGAIGLGFIFAIITTAILSWITGVKDFGSGGGFSIEQKGDPGSVGRHNNYRDSWIGEGDGNLWK